MENKKIEFANSLRGVAALSVIIGHYFGVFWLAREAAAGLTHTEMLPRDIFITPQFSFWLFKTQFNCAVFGVALFFLISGFVIPFSFAKATVTEFLRGRILRIYPLYMAAFSLTVIALYTSASISGNAFPYEAKQVLVHFIPGLRELLNYPSIDGITWTLEIELKFYLLCALIALPLRKASWLTTIVPMVLFFLSLSWFESPDFYLRLFARNFEYIIFMFVGVAFNFAYRQKLSPVLLTISSVVLLTMFWKLATVRGEPFIVINYLIAFAVFACSFLCARWWGKNRFFSFFADISYPLYVVHPIVGYLLLTYLTLAGLPPTQAIFLTFAIAVFLAWGLHHAVEVPAQNLAHRLRNRQLKEKARFTSRSFL